jgi:vacuolar-type H+-ATPase subunit F/Vma7
MSPLWFIGDEVSAVGWHLVGVEVVVVATGSEEKVVGEVFSKASLLIITAQVAQAISPALLERLLASTTVLTHIIGDIQGHHQPVDYAGQLRRQLGLGQ